MKRLIPILAVIAVLGCEEKKPDESKFTGAVAVEAARIHMASSHTPAPTPEPDAKVCPDCKGSGRVKTGDGISTTECDRCGGDGRIAAFRVESPRIEIPITRHAAYRTEDLMVDVADTSPGEAYVVEPTTIIEQDPVCDTCTAGQCATGACDAACAAACATSASSGGNYAVSHREGPVRRSVRWFRSRRPVRRLLGGLFCRSCR